MKITKKTILEAGCLWTVGVGENWGDIKINFLKAMIDDNVNSFGTGKTTFTIIGIFETYEAAIKFRRGFKKSMECLR